MEWVWMESCCSFYSHFPDYRWGWTLPGTLRAFQDAVLHGHDHICAWASFLSSLPDEFLLIVQHPVSMWPSGPHCLSNSSSKNWSPFSLGSHTPGLGCVTVCDHPVALFLPANHSLPYFPWFYCPEQWLAQSGCSLYLWIGFIRFRGNLIFLAESSLGLGGKKVWIQIKDRCELLTSFLYLRLAHRWIHWILS